MREGLRLEEEYPEDILRITYESLCQNPKRVINSIFQFSNLSNDNAVIDYAEKILQTPIAQKPFKVNPVIEDSFTKTMQQLGYQI